MILRDQHSSFSILLGNTSMRKARNWIDLPTLIKYWYNGEVLLVMLVLLSVLNCRSYCQCTHKATVGANNVGTRIAITLENVEYSIQNLCWDFALKSCCIFSYFPAFIETRKVFSTARTVHNPSFELLGFSKLCNT